MGVIAPSCSHLLIAYSEMGTGLHLQEGTIHFCQTRGASAILAATQTENRTEKWYSHWSTPNKGVAHTRYRHLKKPPGDPMWDPLKMGQNSPWRRSDVGREAAMRYVFLSNLIPGNSNRKCGSLYCQTRVDEELWSPRIFIEFASY